MADTPMRRIPRGELPEELQAVWDRLHQLTGEPTFVEVFAQAPELLDFVMGKFYGEIFFGGRVDRRFKEIARLRLSQLHGCRTCNLQNTAGAREVGLSKEQIDALKTTAGGVFSDAEKAVVDFADQVALTNHAGDLDQALYARLSAHFSDAEICELGVVMAVISGMAKLSFVMNLVEREASCPIQPNASAA